MTQEDNKSLDTQPDLGRRKFLNTAALVGLSGAGLSVGLSACKNQDEAAPSEAAPSTPAEAVRTARTKWRLASLMNITRFPVAAIRAMCASTACRPAAN